ncbi:hemerythrin domain-containing protein [Paramicrobacterium agarici]|uniref:hemerythrin domain-containing protein n=1 Tax=Paramicrobacterium agarici TaxID=630514 RepID=UPI0011524BA5|nr:hemerythrin domain-containing protein [Microbacterium agarici]TQO23738.1 hemerythrin HHE cation binding domain-containing protein [Microbacterium agarici]
MTEGEKARFVAWSAELRAVHERLRAALRVTRESLDHAERAVPAARDLLLYCHGFCVALTGHHEAEDRELFPAIAAAHPDLRDTLRMLEQDHSMMSHLIAGLVDAVKHAAPPDELERHVEGISAIMESHFRFEERRLLTVLDALALDADPESVLGPF